MFVSSNKLSDIKKYFHQKLSAVFSEREINLMVKLLTIKRFNISSIDYMTSSQMLLSESDLLYFNFAVKRLQKNEPFQYILGDVEFYGLELNCDSRALIPRPETEELVSWIVESLDRGVNNHIVDLCAGSGCIALALKSKLINSDVIAAELSNDALGLIEDNMLKTKLKVATKAMDVLNKAHYADFKLNSFDCWVSNPPYIPNKEQVKMAENVLSYEPHMALFVEDDDPLIFYREIAVQGKRFLKNGGFLFFEMHEDLSEEMVDMMTSEGFVNIELRKDLQGKQRMLRAQNVIS